MAVGRVHGELLVTHLRLACDDIPVHPQLSALRMAAAMAKGAVATAARV
jgi:hypothetical protein